MRHEPEGTRGSRLLLIAGLVLAATAAGAEDIPIPRERPLIEDVEVGGVTQLFDSDGNRIGMAVEVGNTMIFYDTHGKKTGSMKMIGNRAIYSDARGKRTR
jgi:hypothetical protein